MTHPKHPADPAASGRAFLDEGDIGSGEKTPAQQETEEMIREIPPLQPGSAREHSAGEHSSGEHHKGKDQGQPKP